MSSLRFNVQTSANNCMVIVFSVLNPLPVSWCVVVNLNIQVSNTLNEHDTYKIPKMGGNSLHLQYRYYGWRGRYVYQPINHWINEVRWVGQTWLKYLRDSCQLCSLHRSWTLQSVYTNWPCLPEGELVFVGRVSTQTLPIRSERQRRDRSLVGGYLLQDAWDYRFWDPAKYTEFHLC